MLAEFRPDNRDYFVYLEDADIQELLAGKTVESDLITSADLDINKSRISLKVADMVRGEVSTQVLWEINPTRFTFSTLFFKTVILNDELFEQNSGSCEARIDIYGRKIHVYRGEWFYARGWRTQAAHRLENFERYKQRYAELRARKESE